MTVLLAYDLSGVDQGRTLKQWFYFDIVSNHSNRHLEMQYPAADRVFTLQLYFIALLTGLDVYTI